MLWVWVVVGAAVGGVVMLALFARWLWAKAAVLAEDLGRLADRSADVLDLLDRIEFEPPPAPPHAGIVRRSR